MNDFLKSFAKNLLLTLKGAGIALFCLIVGFGVFACLRALVMWLYYLINAAWAIILSLLILFVVVALIFSILDAVEKRREEKGRAAT